jgi:mono/diheme cytochrome c family protein
VPAVAAGLCCVAVLALLPLGAVAASQPHPGQAPYDTSCKVCHGPEGRGNAGPALVPFELEDEELLARVREGGGEMPPFSEKRVSDDEVKQIASYLRSLKPVAP